MPRARVPDEDAVRFGLIVKQLRTERGVDARGSLPLQRIERNLAGRAGAGRERPPSLATIFKLAEVFGVEAAALVREIEQARRTPAS